MIYNDKIKEDKGFTIVELAMVMIIGGILLATLSSTLLVYLKKTEIKTTQKRIEKIDEALQLFLSLNGRLPCAASLTEPVDTANFGVEISQDCTSAGNVPGTTQINGRGGRTLRIGAVPTRTINLPDDYIADAWGQRFTYVVTEALASPGTYNRQEGAISAIAAGAGASLITPAGSAHYVIISHGKNGFGATTLEGVAGLPCDTTTMEGENCNNDDVFRNTLLTSTANNANLFDDHVVVRATSLFGNEIPPGAVMAFNLNACPQGWVQFTDATGRNIIGTGTYNETYNVPGRPNWSSNEVYSLGDQGGFASWQMDYDEVGIIPYPAPINPLAIPGTISFAQIPLGAQSLPHENRAPYVALLYCQRQ